MAHGSGQWGLNAPKSTIYGGIDLAELAARLGSPVTFDRRGDVIWYDTFEDGISQWLQNIVGTGGAIDWSAACPRHGGFSCKLTAGSTLTASASIISYHKIPVLSAMGFEVTFTVDGNMDNIRFQTNLFDGTYEYLARFHYDHVNKKLQYWDENEAWQDLDASISLEPYYNTYNTLKFVADFATGKYVRAILNEHSYDMAGIPMYTVVRGTQAYARIRLDNFGVDGENGVSYIDSVILTHNEPS